MPWTSPSLDASWSILGSKHRSLVEAEMEGSVPESQTWMLMTKVSRCGDAGAASLADAILITRSADSQHIASNPTLSPAI
jgi:hypothetical protein